MANIDVGIKFTINNANNTVPAYTLLSEVNPSIGSGTLDTFYVWLSTSYGAGTGCKIGTFHGKGTDWQCRDYEIVGDVATGSEQTFSGLDCDVESWDILGWYCTSTGRICYRTGQSGSYIRYLNGDHFSDGEQTYFTNAGWEYYLYGEGTGSISSRRLPRDYNISTYGAVGQGRDYTSLATWEVATQLDLTATGQSKGEVLECYADSASFTDRVDINGATTDTSYYRVIKPASGEKHTGVPETGVYFINSGNNALFQCSEDYIHIFDLCIKNTSTASSNYYGGIHLNCHGTAVGNILYQCTETGGSGVGIGSGNSGVSNYTIVNNLFIECDSGLFHWRTGGTNYIYNNTAVNCTTYGFYGKSAISATNCIAYGNGTDFTNITQTTCSLVARFEDDTSDDYDLEKYDPANIGAGTDLSSAGFAFDDDIDDNTRTRWDIGAFEAQIVSAKKLPLDFNSSTFGGAGLGRDYTSLQTWEVATDNDLVTATKGEVLYCYDDEVFNQLVIIGGATANAYYFRVIMPATGEGHTGLPSTGVRFANTGGANFILTSEHYFGVYDISFDHSAVAKGAIVFKSDYCKAVGCFGKASAGRPTFAVGSGGNSCYFINNVAYGGGGEGFENISGNNLYYNNTVYGCGNNFSQSSGVATAKNCISEDAVGNEWAGTWTRTNYTDDSGVVFTDAGSNDFSLDSTDIAAKEQGADLSADLIYPFNDDIIGGTRS